MFRAFCLTKSMGSPNVSLLSDVSCSYIPRRHYFPIALLCEKSPFHSRLPLLLPARRVPLSSPLFLAALEVALVRLRTPKPKWVCLLVLARWQILQPFQATLAPGHIYYVYTWSNSFECKDNHIGVHVSDFPGIIGAHSCINYAAGGDRIVMTIGPTVGQWL